MAVEWGGTADVCCDPMFHPVSCKCITPRQREALMDFWDRSAHPPDAEDERFMDVLTEAHRNPPTLPSVAADLDGFIVRAWPTEATVGVVVALCGECSQVVITWEGDVDLGDLARAALNHECRT